MGKPILNYKEIPSTNREAERLILEGIVVENTFLVAEYQSDGKGRSQNKWISEAGKNLLMSWIVFTEVLSVSRQFLLSKAVSLALIDMLNDFAIPCRIKWPNDIVFHSNKLGGILIENSIMGSKIRHSIAGIGLNVNQLDFPSFPYAAVSMASVSGKNFELIEVRDHLIAALEKRLELIQAKDFSILDLDYLNHLFRLDEAAVFSAEGSEFEGIIRGVDETGQLLVERGAVLSSFGFHEIKLKY